VAYVIIEAKGLSGLGKAPGAINSRAGNTGLFSGKPGLQRGMRDGLGPHFFAPPQPGTRGGVFRDFARQRVGGLGSLGSSATVGITSAQITIARAGLAALAAKALLVKNTTTNVQTEETARLAHDYASRVGPTRINAIAANPTAASSVLGFANVQAATQRITDILGVGFVEAIVRFTSLPLAVTASIVGVTPQSLDEAREAAIEVVDTSLAAASNVPNPFNPSTIPWWVAPLAIVGVVAYAASQLPRSGS